MFNVDVYLRLDGMYFICSELSSVSLNKQRFSCVLFSFSHHYLNIIIATQISPIYKSKLSCVAIYKVPGFSNATNTNPSSGRVEYVALKIEFYC